MQMCVGGVQGHSGVQGGGCREGVVKGGRGCKEEGGVWRGAWEEEMEGQVWVDGGRGLWVQGVLPTPACWESTHAISRVCMWLIFGLALWWIICVLSCF